VGHATFLVQAGGLNLLTDPVWSRRASPSQLIGPARFVPPGVDFDALPPLDAILLSHDHYDHLDAPTVRRLHARFGDAVPWVTPLGYRAWFEGAGVRAVTELDWWEETRIEKGGASARVVCAPAQHWTRRRMREYNDRLWASYALIFAGGTRIYFGGDSGWFAGYDEIGERLGPFDVTMLPIGAYEPRWFMRPAHMNPEEAVRAYGQLGGRGKFVAMHWGTFRLTDEDPLEPPVRTRAAWRAAGLPERDLAIPRHGETL
jgi:N-acyl-phosphatidylethanolamine-hydrolysing phospholipase D